MTPPNTTNKEGLSAAQKAKRYRIAGIVILLLGLAGAGGLYWLEPQPPDYSDDPSMLGFERSEAHEMGVLYGKQGQLIQDVDDSLKQPGTQAVLIVFAAGLIAAGCFRFAVILEHEAKDQNEESPHKG